MILAIVPAYNEEKNIDSVIRDLFHHVDEVVVIDDGSTDATARIAREAGATILTHRVNRGQGAALETGHDYARLRRADFVVHFDADGQFSASDIPGALAYLQTSQKEVVLGSRFLGAEKSIPWFKRWFILPLGRLIDRLSGTVRLSDSHNGFRILSRRALDVIRITQDRMAHATEIPTLIAKHSLSWVEYPVSVRYNEFGQGVGGGFKIVRDLLLGKFLR